MKIIEDKWWGIILKVENEEEKEIVENYYNLLKDAIIKKHGKKEEDYISDYITLPDDKDEFYHGRPE